MRAISLHQPWATAVVRGLKVVETRPRRIPPGRLFIHAALRWDAYLARIAREWPFSDWFKPLGIEFGRISGGRYPRPRNYNLFPLGCLCGYVEVLDCIPTESATSLWSVYEDGAAERYAEEVKAGDYTPGRWAWLLGEPHWFTSPLFTPGRQWLFDVPTETAGRLVEFAVPAADTVKPWRPQWRPLTPRTGALA